jgi:dipeptidyl aminopeptidase/acylaminoacyl peptidase
MFYEMVGNPESDKELLAETSPVMHADNIRAPLLIAQGAQDPRVNVDESDQMGRGAQKARDRDRISGQGKRGARLCQ